MTRKTMPGALDDTELDILQGGANSSSGDHAGFLGESTYGHDWLRQEQNGSRFHLDGSDVGLSAKRRFETDFGDHVGNYN